MIFPDYFVLPGRGRTVRPRVHKGAFACVIRTLRAGRAGGHDRSTIKSDRQGIQAIIRYWNGMTTVDGAIAADLSHQKPSHPAHAQTDTSPLCACGEDGRFARSRELSRAVRRTILSVRTMFAEKNIEGR